MEWRDSEAHARSDPDPLRGALSGRHRPALGQGRRRPRSIVLIRRRDGDDRPKIPQLYAQLSEFDPALRETGDWNCCRVAAFSVRFDLWPLFDRVITSGGKRILEISVKRYAEAISGVYEHE